MQTLTITNPEELMNVLQQASGGEIILLDHEQCGVLNVSEMQGVSMGSCADQDSEHPTKERYIHLATRYRLI